LELPSRGWRGGNLHLRMLSAKYEQLRAMSCQWCCGFPLPGFPSCLGSSLSRADLGCPRLDQGWQGRSRGADQRPAPRPRGASFWRPAPSALPMGRSFLAPRTPGAPAPLPTLALIKTLQINPEHRLVGLSFSHLVI
jgi:hypothetical protein